MVRARNMKKKPQPAQMTILATTVAIDDSVNRASNPTIELVIYAVSIPGKLSS